MLRFVIALGAAWMFAGCTNSTLRSQEGHACSTNPSDDPQLMCTPAQDLVCIATYSRMITNQQEAMKFDGGIRQVFVCRLACNATAECPQALDICCKGTIYGKTYNKIGGCVPPGSCDGDESGGDDGGAPSPDAGGAKDTAGGQDAPGAQDTGAPDSEAVPVADGGAAG